MFSKEDIELSSGVCCVNEAYCECTGYSSVRKKILPWDWNDTFSTNKN